MNRRAIPQNLNILLIDDSEFDYFVVKEHLSDVKNTDIALDWAPNYQEGLERAALGRHDINLVDLNLGETSGFDFAHQVKQTGYDTPLIMYSGMDKDYIDWRRAADLFKGYIPKENLTPERVVSEIQRVVVDPNASVPSQNWSLSDTILEALPMPMLVVRQDATIANANQNVLELLGLNFSDVQGTHVSLLMNQSKREVERMIDQNHRDILQTSIPNSDRFIGWSYSRVSHPDYPDSAGVLLGMVYPKRRRRASILRKLQNVVRSVVSDPQYIRRDDIYFNRDLFK